MSFCNFFIEGISFNFGQLLQYNTSNEFNIGIFIKLSHREQFKIFKLSIFGISVMSEQSSHTNLFKPSIMGIFVTASQQIISYVFFKKVSSSSL
jgi:hypothetical protein